MFFRAILHWDNLASWDNAGGGEPLRKPMGPGKEWRLEADEVCISTNTIISYISEVCKVQQRCLFMQKVVSKPQTTKYAGEDGENICIHSCVFGVKNNINHKWMFLKISQSWKISLSRSVTAETICMLKRLPSKGDFFLIIIFYLDC